MSRYVFDAFALLAYYQFEPGRERVETLLRETLAGEHNVWMTVVNFGEVLYGLEHKSGADAFSRALADAAQLPIDFVEIDRDLALNAATIKAEYRIGYMDCFAVALGARLDATVVTGDDDFKGVQNLVDIDWLPRRGS